MTLTREIIYSSDFPLKPHNGEPPSPLTPLTRPAPAVKVPGLVFLAGQTATGEIKAATVRPSVMQYLIHLRRRRR